MNGNRPSSNRPAEVQLGQCPVELSPASTPDSTGYSEPSYETWFDAGTAITPDRSNAGRYIPLGTSKWVPSAEEVLESYQRAVVVVKVGKDGTVSTGPSRIGRF